MIKVRSLTKKIGQQEILRGVDLEDVGDTDLGDVLVVENPAGRGLAGLGDAQGVAVGAQGVAVTSVIAARAAAWSAMACPAAQAAARELRAAAALE